MKSVAVSAMLHSKSGTYWCVILSKLSVAPKSTGAAVPNSIEQDNRAQRVLVEVCRDRNEWAYREHHQTQAPADQKNPQVQPRRHCHESGSVTALPCHGQGDLGALAKSSECGTDALSQGTCHQIDQRLMASQHQWENQKVRVLGQDDTDVLRQSIARDFCETARPFANCQLHQKDREFYHDDARQQKIRRRYAENHRQFQSGGDSDHPEACD